MTVQEQADIDSESARIQILIIKNSIQSLTNVVKHTNNSIIPMWIDKNKEAVYNLLKEKTELSKYKVKYPERFL